MSFPTPLVVALLFALGPAGGPPGPAEIQVVDAATGRGVPLVELETTHGVRLVTDNAGRAAFAEPELFGTEVWLSVRGHGYGVKADGFGYRGVRVTPAPGAPVVIQVDCEFPAERIGRLTGAGRWRDSALLGHDTPPDLNGRVAGQDSVQPVIYQDRAYWFWGDTSRLSYPLGLFRMAAATTPIPAGLTADDDVLEALRYNYLTGPDGFVRAAIPLPDRPEGVVWIDGLCVVPDERGEERLICHYSRREGLAKELDHGVAVWDDEAAEFQSVSTLLTSETWRHPKTHPIRYEADGREWLLFGAPTPNVRVPATLAAVLDPAQYEAFAPTEEEGAPVWRWQTDEPPSDSKAERERLDAGRLAPADARFLPADAADPTRRVQLHSGTVRWNEHQKKWVLIAGQIGGTSHLGEVWYAEADAPTGPFKTAVKIASHERQTFYNVCQHPVLDADGSRVIHFEGTFTRDFSGNPEKVPRYEYNQLLYRLDLDAAALRAAQD
ncbi:hypothetical protein [Alienimonas californiensis]|uniref:DUF4185 domain-containing protein n=1 Tax=Alienimonas californiensis TaxID=2527989 RepID=A0A517P7E0_9PLAN|nr:hypothetical protein [Alienimonas californiensis]QDT15292.1 hypothetical protein CA12_13750 [Alienimonas californiensis]